MITQLQLKEILHYNPETGIFIWKVNKSRRAKTGMRAGSKHTTGDVRIFINGKSYKAHRVAWLYVYGNFPGNKIDHQNGIKDDNKISKLKDVSHTENMKNHPVHKNSKSGFIGVSWHKKTGKWQADISVNKKTIYLGIFSNISDAVKVRIDAEAKYGYHINHGR